MSTRKYRLVLTPEAKQDMRDILLHTGRRWGKLQRRTYKTKLDQAIRGLTDFPYRGRAEDDISVGLHALPIEAHVIYYRVADNVVSITRVLHEKMDAAAHLRP
jgi:toxin ParE1/3/4